MAGTVALVGALHPAARALALRLEDEPAVERVLGLSGHEPPLLGPKFEFVHATPGSERFAAALASADAVVLFPPVEMAERDPANDPAGVEDATEQTLRAASKASTLVLWSSGVVYGAHPDNPVPIPETQPVSPNEDFAAAGALAQAEQAVLGAAERNGRPTVTVLRAGAIWAPAWGTFLARALQAPAILAVRGYDPPVQALDPRDAVEALVLAVRGALPGTYNVAPADWMPAKEAARTAGRRRVELSERLAFTTTERLGRLGISSASPGELRCHMHPWVLDSSRLRAAGWTPRSTTAAALADAARARTDDVGIGGVQVRRSDLYKGAAAGVAVVATLALVRRQARRR
jgi:nucleoside-diphosphate-sugar epimerase